MPNTCFWRASHFCQDRKWIFLQPEDGGPASVHSASPTGLGSVKELICHSHLQMVEGRCTTHFSGLLFINRVSLATTSRGLTHSAASKWLPCAHQASWGQSQNENLQVQGPHGVAVWPARNMSFHWPGVTPSRTQSATCSGVWPVFPKTAFSMFAISDHNPGRPFPTNP